MAVLLGLRILNPALASAECRGSADGGSVTCDRASFDDLTHEAVELDGEVEKLHLDLDKVAADLRDRTDALAFCKKTLAAVPGPSPWAKYGYGLGLVGAFALATAGTVNYSPDVRVVVGFGGLAAMAAGYWIVVP